MIVSFNSNVIGPLSKVSPKKSHGLETHLQSPIFLPTKPLLGFNLSLSSPSPQDSSPNPTFMQRQSSDSVRLSRSLSL